MLPSLAALVASIAPTGAALAQSTGGTHEVQPGETLWQIAQAAGTDSVTLLRLNGLEDGDLIYAGQKLSLPGGAAAPAMVPIVPAAPVPASVASYTVAEGDTLFGIALTNGVSVDAIVQANNLEDPNQLSLGTVLKLPGGSAPAAAEVRPAPTAAPAPAATPAPARAAGSTGSSGRSFTTTYLVQPGETLNGIARQYNVSVDTIAKATGIDDPNRLVVGATLKIPLPGREHVIQPGETLYGIAALEKVDLGVLIDTNEITDPALIRVGDVLLVPAPSVPQSAAAIPNPPAPQPTPAPTPEPAPATPTPAPAAAQAPAPAAQATPARPASPTPAATPARQAAPIPAGVPTDVPLVGAAAKLLGLPYVFGGSGPDSFDCSGLVWYAAKQVGKPMPRGLFAQYDNGTHPSRDQLKPGDIVFFQNTYMPGLSHNGIYIGGGRFIHAADERSGVTISSMDSTYWATRYFGATRPN